jgi:hypothetical protein
LIGKPDPIDDRDLIFEGWMGAVEIHTSDPSARMDLHRLNRAGRWYNTKSYTDSGQLVPIEDMQHIQDRCDE